MVHDRIITYPYNYNYSSIEHLKTIILFNSVLLKIMVDTYVSYKTFKITYSHCLFFIKICN